MTLSCYACRMVQPIILGQLIDWFDPNEGSSMNPYLLSVLYGLLSVVSGFILQPNLWIAAEIGHRLR